MQTVSQPKCFKPLPAATHYGDEEQYELSPAKGNVAFAAPLYGWSFTLQSFASLYAEVRCVALRCALTQRCLALACPVAAHVQTHHVPYHTSCTGASRPVLYCLPLYCLCRSTASRWTPRSLQSGCGGTGGTTQVRACASACTCLACCLRWCLSSAGGVRWGGVTRGYKLG